VTDHTPQEIRDEALRYAEGGLSVIPIGADKTPVIKWGAHQEVRATAGTIARWFADKFLLGIAVLCGVISGGVEVFDFDDPAALPKWRDLLEEHLPGLFERLMLILTPSGGYQIVYKCPEYFNKERIGEKEKTGEKFGSLKLARRKIIIEDSQIDPALHSFVEVTKTNPKTGEEIKELQLKVFIPEKAKYKTAKRDPIDNVWSYVDEIIETRADDGYVATSPSSAICHPTGKLYTILAGDWCDLPIITEDERDVMIAIARSLDEMPEREVTKAERVTLPKTGGDDLSVGDDFNRRANWGDILEPHGWRYVGSCGGASEWKRPGDTKANRSATTNGKGTDTLAVFTTATIFDDVMESGTTYSKFAAYAYLNHNGDFKEATKALAAQGYGNQEWKPRKFITEEETDGEAARSNVIALPSLDYAVTVAFACWNISDAGYRTFQAVKQIFNGRKVYGLSGSYIARHIKSTASLESPEPSESDKRFGNRRVANLVKELAEKCSHKIFTVHEKGSWKEKKAGRYRLDLGIFETLMKQPDDTTLTFEKAVYQKAAEYRITGKKEKTTPCHACGGAVSVETKICSNLIIRDGRKEPCGTEQLQGDVVKKIFTYCRAANKKAEKIGDWLSDFHGENHGALAEQANQIVGTFAEKVYKGIAPSHREFFELEKNIIKPASWETLKKIGKKTSEKSGLGTPKNANFSLKSDHNPYQTQSFTESLGTPKNDDFSLEIPQSENPQKTTVALCQDCLREQQSHQTNEGKCICGGDTCHCSDCLQKLELLKAGYLDRNQLGVKVEMESWSAETGFVRIEKKLNNYTDKSMQNGEKGAA
jgi:hypothetical protein